MHGRISSGLYKHIICNPTITCAPEHENGYSGLWYDHVTGWHCGPRNNVIEIVLGWSAGSCPGMVQQLS